MRIRTIKPEFFTHEGLFDAERATKLPLRIAFAGLWCAADRSGRFKWEPRRLGIAILPYDEIDFSRVLDALLTRAFIVKYRVGDEWFGAIPSWEKHQVVNNREKSSEIPDVSHAEELDASSTRAPRVRHASKEEGKGKEGEGKGTVATGEPSRARERNALLDALCQFSEMTDPNAAAGMIWPKLAKALQMIKTATPDVTAAEIERRCVNYRTHFRDAAISSTALASHWGRCADSNEQPGTTRRMSFA